VTRENLNPTTAFANVTKVKLGEVRQWLYRKYLVAGMFEILLAKKNGKPVSILLLLID
jgi:hypothetical protein